MIVPFSMDRPDHPNKIELFLIRDGFNSAHNLYLHELDRHMRPTKPKFKPQEQLINNGLLNNKSTYTGSYMYPEQISCGELLDKQNKIILGPKHIPIHPSVYNSDFAYTQNFTNKVMYSIEESVSRDIEDIRKALGTNIKYKKPNIELFNVHADPVRRSVDLVYGSSYIAIEPQSTIENIISSNEDLPPAMIGRIWKIFSTDKEKIQIYSWYEHNISDNEMGNYLYFRNFAKQFNNLGIEEIKNKMALS